MGSRRGRSSSLMSPWFLFCVRLHACSLLVVVDRPSTVMSIDCVKCGLSLIELRPRGGVGINVSWHFQVAACLHVAVCPRVIAGVCMNACVCVAGRAYPVRDWSPRVRPQGSKCCGVA